MTSAWWTSWQITAAATPSLPKTFARAAERLVADDDRGPARRGGDQLEEKVGGFDFGQMVFPQHHRHERARHLPPRLRRHRSRPPLPLRGHCIGGALATGTARQQVTAVQARQTAEPGIWREL